MDDSFKKLESCCLKQISLLEGLRDCQEEERQRLAHTELDSLWDLFERKLVMMRALEACVTEVQDLLKASAGIPGGASVIKAQGRFKDIFMAIARLKEEIRERAKENMNFIRDCLSFLDGLAGSLAGAGQNAVAYSRSGRRPDNGAPLIVRKEV